MCSEHLFLVLRAKSSVFSRRAKSSALGHRVACLFCSGQDLPTTIDTSSNMFKISCMLITLKIQLRIKLGGQGH